MREMRVCAHCAGLNFQFRDPAPGFDRAAVKGVMARLVKVKDMAAATALEVAAGGKLYQLVVDSEATAKALLSRGQLRNRVTIIPLNKVWGRTEPLLKTPHAIPVATRASYPTC
jgi:structural maintenance of chromosome 2